MQCKESVTLIRRIIYPLFKYILLKEATVQSIDTFNRLFKSFNTYHLDRFKHKIFLNRYLNDQRELKFMYHGIDVLLFKKKLIFKLWHI
jgi:hypothetical protein